MENLDQYFGNVCELDIVFNFHKVYGILDEIIVGGEILETAKDTIVNSIKNLEVEDWYSIVMLPCIPFPLYSRVLKHTSKTYCSIKDILSQLVHYFCYAALR